MISYKKIYDKNLKLNEEGQILNDGIPLIIKSPIFKFELNNNILQLYIQKNSLLHSSFIEVIVNIIRNYKIKESNV